VRVGLGLGEQVVAGAKDDRAQAGAKRLGAWQIEADWLLRHVAKAQYRRAHRHAVHVHVGPDLEGDLEPLVLGAVRANDGIDHGSSGGLAANYIYDIATDTNGNIWFATSSAGVSKFNGTATWQKYTIPVIAGTYVRDIHIAKDGKVWLATGTGASAYNGTTWTNYTTSNSGLRENLLYSVSSDNYGNIWFGGQDKGLSKFDETNWSYYSVFEGLANTCVYHIAIDKNNVKWFATGGGVSKAICVAPLTDFSTDVACYPASTVFTNLTTKTDNTTKYEWDIYNDDTIDYTTKNIIHKMKSFGYYQVKLNAINDNCSYSVSHDVFVNSMPDISILPSDTSIICEGNNFKLSAIIKNYCPFFQYKYEWSNGSADSIINITDEEKYFVKVINENCIRQSDTAYIKVIKPYDQSKICLVTVDSATGKNKIIWEKTPDKNIQSYNIYKVFGTLYQPIGNLPFGDLTVFKDFTSIPESMVDRYAISAIDSCGNESVKSPYHQTMLLQAATGTATNEAVLNWNKYIDESGVWVPEYYYIYKGKTKSSMALLDSVSGILETRYNDQKFDGISAYYQCSIRKKTPCDPANLLKAESGPYTQSLSNIVEFKTGSALDAANELAISSYPNPFSENLTLEFSLDKNSDVLIEVINATGQKTAEFSYKDLAAGTQQIQLSAAAMNIAEGLCYLKIVAAEKTSVVKCSLIK
jgi:hypothetical protein